MRSIVARYPFFVLKNTGGFLHPLLMTHRPFALTLFNWYVTIERKAK
jgi:hypothetical protein